MAEWFSRGRFWVFDSDDPTDWSTYRCLDFMFNPEGLSRALEFEEGERDASTGEWTSGPGLSETISLTLRFDLDERMRNYDAQMTAWFYRKYFGLWPEISALEDLMYPGHSGEAGAYDDAFSFEDEPRPYVVFEWGRRLKMPVRIVAMTIKHTQHDAQLLPTRAEVDVELEAVNTSAGGRHANRRQNVRLYYTGSIG